MREEGLSRETLMTIMWMGMLERWRITTAVDGQSYHRVMVLWSSHAKVRGEASLVMNEPEPTTLECAQLHGVVWLLRHLKEGKAIFFFLKKKKRYVLVNGQA